MLSSPSITAAQWMINFNRQKIASQGLFINKGERERGKKVKITAYSVRSRRRPSFADTYNSSELRSLSFLAFTRRSMLHNYPTAMFSLYDTMQAS